MLHILISRDQTNLAKLQKFVLTPTKAFHRASFSGYMTNAGLAAVRFTRFFL